MARITLDHIRHAYGPNPTSPSDYSLPGPSGCGKTTLLNIISGLLQPSEGKILFDGRDVTNLSTQDRNIAQVFQFPVIYDTMTVYDNLAFPLRNRKVAEADVDRRVTEILEMIDAWVTLIVMDVWHWTSLVVLLCYAGLVSIPDAYYQAAKIDGVSRWSVFRYIQLPKMKRVLLIAFLLRFMGLLHRDDHQRCAELTGGGRIS